MHTLPVPWDYLVLTASNQEQARAYAAQLELRRGVGMLSQVREALVVPDPEGRRAGSGGSTVGCLAEIVRRERERRGASNAEEALGGLRILIVHAGGDSRRLPAYAACGKIFVPVPGESYSALGTTLFDRLVPEFLALPAGGSGQVVVAAGDALLRFDPSAVRFDPGGLTALGCYAAPEEAARHGVFCADPDGGVRVYLQKPPLEEQQAQGAINRYGQSILDVGVMNFDAPAAAALLAIFEPLAGEILENGLDLYREICCAMGAQATPAHHARTARASGSSWSEAALGRIFPALHAIPFHVEVLPRCAFLHFGRTRQLVTSGLALAGQEPGNSVLSLNNECGNGQIAGRNAWVEGSRVGARLTLAGGNAVTGVDIGEPLSLPEGACLDVQAGRGRDGVRKWFVRCYGVNDTFKDDLFCGVPLAEWLAAAGAKPEDVWETGARTLWEARLFPAEDGPGAYRRWLWMYDPAAATPGDKAAFRAAERYSAAQIARLADQDEFHARRARIRAGSVRQGLRRMFSQESSFSAADLALALRFAPDRAALAAELLAQAQFHRGEGGGLENFTCCRIVHSLGTAVAALAGAADQPLEDVLPGIAGNLAPAAVEWSRRMCISVDGGTQAGEWARHLHQAAFNVLNETILNSSLARCGRPRNALRPDETTWGRAPARIELGGGWTDTPPYTLEYGGHVTNVAVNLNGQPPIHCYGRIMRDPIIRLTSIDGGQRLEITDLAELLDYRRPGDSFALSKAALAIAGFSPSFADWGAGVTLRQMLEEFGGGIDLTTLVGIPQGSGLGTSSILGAVIIGVLRRMMGQSLGERAIFHDVLRLEQALTTGGGWQDQVGGGVGGAKITATARGLIPDPRIHYAPHDLIDPRLNGGTTLLYYTGLTRLAKNILAQIVGHYFDRDRATMQALAEEHIMAHALYDALARKDAAAFGRYLDAAWELHKRLCGMVTNEAIDALMARARPHVHGMLIPGAGSGGFLLMIAKTPRDAAQIREMLEREPLNERARFFDFQVNEKGLEVTTC